MQSIWSRVASARCSCRCSSCATVSGFSRGNASRATRRKVTASDVFVACYSAIFASATLADAQSKNKRRQELDRMIEDTKREVVRAGKLADATEHRVPKRRRVTPLEHVTWADTLARVSGSNGILLQTADPLDDVLDANPRGRRSHSEVERPKTVWKLEAQQRSVLRVVSRIISQIARPIQGRESSELRSSCRRLLGLFSGATSAGAREYPHYEQDCSFSTHRRHRDLNDQMRRLTRDQSESGCDTRLVLTKICGALLLSPSAPSAETYNILMDFFMRQKMNTLAYVLIDSLLETRIMPDSSMAARALRFYTSQNDLPAFNHFVRLMRGIEGGLGSWKSYTSTTAHHPEILADRGRFFKGRGTLVERCPRDSQVFGALIEGALSFELPQRARVWYRAMVKEGWSPPMSTLFAILRESLTKRDWLSGMAIWREITLAVHRSGKAATDILPWDVYHCILMLCQACRQDEMFITILHEAEASNLKPTGSVQKQREHLREWKARTLTQGKAAAIKHPRKVLEPKEQSNDMGSPIHEESTDAKSTEWIRPSPPVQLPVGVSTACIPTYAVDTGLHKPVQLSVRFSTSAAFQPRTRPFIGESSS